MGTPAGFSGAGAYEVLDALRLNVGWYDSGLETSGSARFGHEGVMAVGAGMCDHVLCFRSVWEGSAQGGGGRSAVMPGGGGGGSFKASGFMEWTLPFSAPSASIWIAMFAQAHFHKYGTTKEQLAWIALERAPERASSNPKAIYRDPMTFDDYMASRMITTPFSLYDCDVPCDGATAVIVSAARSCGRTCRTGRCGSSRWARRCTVGRPGTSSTTSRRCRTAMPARSCGRAPT